MVCTVPISQNVAIHQLLLISVYIFACARSSESTREFVMKYFCWLSFLEFEECSIFLIEIWSIEIFSISSYTKLQSIILRSFECNLIPGTSYRSDKWIHFSSNQFMNGILTWFGCNFPSETRELFWAITFTTLFSLWNMVHQSKHFFTAFGTEQSQRTCTSKFFIICSF